MEGLIRRSSVSRDKRQGTRIQKVLTVRPWFGEAPSLAAYTIEDLARPFATAAAGPFPSLGDQVLLFLPLIRWLFGKETRHSLQK